MRQMKPERIKDAVSGCEDVTAGRVIQFETENVNIDALFDTCEVAR
jgi:hypothetical protein